MKESKGAGEPAPHRFLALLAVVADPTRSLLQIKVEIPAFKRPVVIFPNKLKPTALVPMLVTACLLDAHSMAPRLTTQPAENSFVFRRNVDIRHGKSLRRAALIEVGATVAMSDIDGGCRE